MCGIFAYVVHGVERSRDDVVSVLLNGLRRLEYRGYDSAGIALDDSRSDADGNRLALVIKGPGTVMELADRVKTALLSRENYRVRQHVGLAHTRWATHGAPSLQNSHPQSSGPENEFLVVHNGIITNYAALRQVLAKRGYEFVSETDTEVVAKLLKHLFTEMKSLSDVVSFPRLVMLMMHELEGAYALAIRSQHFPGEMIACKRGSPLVLGLKYHYEEVPGTEPNQEAPRVTSGQFAAQTKLADRSLPGGFREPGDGEIGSPLARTGTVTMNGSERLEAASVNSALGSKGSAPWNRAPMSTYVRRRTPRRHSVDFKVAQVNLDSDLPHGFSFDAGLAMGNSACGERVAGVELFFASDVSALIEHTREVLVLEDNDVVHACADGSVDIFSFLDAESQSLLTQTRALCTLDIELEQIERGRFEHYMLKEIFEQPESLRGTMRGRLQPSTSTVLLGGLRERLDDIVRSTRLIFVGCGTSYHAALACRQLVEQLTELAVSVELSSDFLDRSCPLFRSDVCIFVSQSGETADTLEALRYAKRRHALTVGVVNVVGSAIARLTDCGVHLNAGCEIGVASTKAYTSQIVAITMIALLLSADRLSKRERREEIIRGLGALPAAVERVLQLNDRLRMLASNELREAASILVCGRGYQYATCLEAALKIKEVSYIHTEGIHAGELKHGPLALIDHEMPMIVFATRDHGYDAICNATHQLLARGNPKRMIVVCSDGDASTFQQLGIGTVLEVPSTVDCLQGVVNIIPMQLIAYHLAVVRGLNVDQPRNLAKSVTVQ
jgi:glucosamine--fructose-6-phosphate aminotransferase (isomerizing)